MAFGLKHALNPILAAALAAAALLVSAPATVAQNVPPAAAPATDRAALESRRLALFAAMLRNPADLDTAFAYAQASAALGDIEAAIATLERMLVFAPGLPRVQLELAVLYYRLGAVETARGYLDAVRDQDMPPEVRARVERFSAVVAREARPYRFGGIVSGGVQAHTNANAAPGGGTVIIGGVPIVLGPGAVAAPDTSIFGLARLRFAYDLPVQGTILEADLTAYYSDYFTQNRLDLGLLELAVGPSFDLGGIGIEGTRLGLYGIGGIVVLGGGQYSAALGAGARLRSRLDARFSIEAGAEFRSMTYTNSATYPTAALQDGTEVRGWLHLDGLIDDRTAATLALDTRFVTGTTAFRSFSEIGLSARATRQFAGPQGGLIADDQPWSFSVAAGGTARSFAGPDPLISAVAQADIGYFLEASLGVPLRNNFAAFLTGQYRGQTSNYPTRAYDGAIFTLGLSKRF